MPIEINNKNRIVAIIDDARVVVVGEDGKEQLFRTVPKGSHFTQYVVKETDKAEYAFETDGYFHVGGGKLAHKDDFRIDEQGEDFLGIEHVDND